MCKMYSYNEQQWNNGRVITNFEIEKTITKNDNNHLKRDVVVFFPHLTKLISLSTFMN